MRVLAIAAALAALSCAGALAAPCTAPTVACAATLPPPPPPEPARPQRPRAQPRDDIRYDVRRERNKAMFMQFYSQSAACMREGSSAQLQYGNRNSADIRAWTAQVCGGPLRAWLTSEKGEGMPEKQADRLIHSMTGKALDAALRGPDAYIVR